MFCDVSNLNLFFECIKVLCIILKIAIKMSGQKIRLNMNQKELQCHVLLLSIRICNNKKRLTVFVSSIKFD